MLTLWRTLQRKPELLHAGLWCNSVIECTLDCCRVHSHCRYSLMFNYFSKQPLMRYTLICQSFGTVESGDKPCGCIAKAQHSCTRFGKQRSRLTPLLDVKKNFEEQKLSSVSCFLTNTFDFSYTGGHYVWWPWLFRTWPLVAFVILEHSTESRYSATAIIVVLFSQQL